MQRRTQVSLGTALVVGVLFLALIGGVTLGPSLVSIRDSASEATQTAGTVTPTPSSTLEKARAALARVRDEVIPRDGLATDYGASFSREGYKTLIQWNEEVKVEERFADGFVSLDLRLPCCDWSKPSRDEKANCACGHHQALEGLAKKLLAEGRAPATVQVEISRWARYMYPKEALAAEMEKRAQLDPEIKAALEELKARGEC